MLSSLRKWLQVSLFNLLLVSIAGIILRYKIAFSLPFIDQKYLLHGHSHFAFAGWITQALMALLVANLSERRNENCFPKYRKVLYANLLTAYGMLFTFPFMGYGFLSILFSTLSIFVSYAFALLYWKDLNRTRPYTTSNAWFKLALLCNVVSSIGPFSLAYMMAAKNIPQNWYLTSIYFFLHFQYNGWFFFACMGLLFYQLYKYGIPGKKLKQVFLYFAFASIPTFFLSLLWWPVPSWLYTLVILGSLSQLAGWCYLLVLVRAQLIQIRKKIAAFPLYLLAICAVAETVKLCLQTGSLIPVLAKLAFGFRPIVIGYLHLVLLAVTSIFILGYVFALEYVSITKRVKSGMIVFVCGIFLNELLLMTQGIADINYIAIPFIEWYLLIAAILLFTGILILNYGFRPVKIRRSRPAF